MEQPKFSPEVQNELEQICANAIRRAIDNGTYQHIELEDEKEAE